MAIRIRLFDILRSAGEAEKIRYTNDRNDMFDDLSEEFLLINGRTEITCSLQDGLSVMRTIEAARESNAARGARVALRNSSPTIKL